MGIAFTQIEYMLAICKQGLNHSTARDRLQVVELYCFFQKLRNIFICDSPHQLAPLGAGDR